MTRGDKRADVVLVAEEVAGARAIDGETPFVIGLIGNFSGGAGRGRKPVAVDRDNFDEVLAQMGPQIRLPCLGEHRFRELDDFHPGRLAAMLPDETAEIQAAPAPSGLEQPGNVLEQIIAESAEPELSSAVPSSAEFGDYVEQLVRPHLTRPPDPREQQREEQRLRTVSEKLREILHAPAFQELESAWRAVFLMVRRLETSGQLKVYLIDLPKEELYRELAGEKPRETGLAKLLLESSGRILDGNRWSVLAVNCMFGRSDLDLAVMDALAGVGRAVGTPVLAGAKLEILGCPTLQDLEDPDEWSLEPDPGWRAVRQSDAAPYLGLALPRFLLRMPYGRETDPCDSIEFEEIEGPPEHGDYLWGNPAFACALLLGQAFERHGWQFRPGAVSELDGLPLHVYKLGGEALSTPCAETWLNDAAVERILEAGVMPLVSWRNTDRVRVARFQSIADPPSPLAGAWG